MKTHLKKGQLVRHRRGSSIMVPAAVREMTGVIVTFHTLSGNPIVLWDDGRQLVEFKRNLERIPLWG